MTFQDLRVGNGWFYNQLILHHHAAAKDPEGLVPVEITYIYYV
jgi:hypothetical protein